MHEKAFQVVSELFLNYIAPQGGMARFLKCITPEQER